MSSPKISKYFTLAEVDCNCGCGYRPSDEFVAEMDKLREAISIPMTITSAARCDAQNKKFGGAPNSQHKLANAIDVVVPVTHRWKLVKAAMELGWTGVGVNKEFIHLDRRTPGSAIFTY